MNARACNRKSWTKKQKYHIGVSPLRVYLGQKSLRTWFGLTDRKRFSAEVSLGWFEETWCGYEPESIIWYNKRSKKRYWTYWKWSRYWIGPVSKQFTHLFLFDKGQMLEWNVNSSIRSPDVVKLGTFVDGASRCNFYDLYIRVKEL